VSWHFLQGQEAASWEGSSSAGAPSALSSLIPTVDPSCLPASAMESFPGSPSGMTCGPSTGNPGAATSMLSREDSPAKTFPAPARAQGSAVNEADSGWKWPGSFARFDRASCSWKTRQCYFLAGLDEFSETWPQWGMMRGGECSEQQKLALRTSEPESGWWPTPVKSDMNARRPSLNWVGSDLVSTVWFREGGKENPAKPPANLNPGWVEWLMGWPLEWTDLRPLATDRFRQWCDSHGLSWVDR